MTTRRGRVIGATSPSAGTGLTAEERAKLSALSEAEEHEAVTLARLEADTPTRVVGSLVRYASRAEFSLGGERIDVPYTRTLADERVQGYFLIDVLSAIALDDLRVDLWGFYALPDIPEGAFSFQTTQAGSFAPTVNNSGEPLSWDMGDGTTYQVDAPSHTYATGVLKTVTLSSTDSFAGLSLLYMEGLSLTGPMQFEIGNLSQLEVLRIGRGNSMSGVLPESFFTLVRLRETRIEQNNFSGPIPESLGRLVNMETLRWHSNNFSGPLPQALGLLVKLSRIEVYRNQLTGQPPASIGNCVQLLYLQLQQCFFAGSIPREWGTLTKLEQLVCNHNFGFGGVIPIEIANWVQLDRLRIHVCSFSGYEPGALATQPATFIEANNNQFSGADIDAILADRVAYQAANPGFRMRRFRLFNNAPPSAAGQLSVEALAAAGVAVTTD